MVVHIDLHNSAVSPSNEQRGLSYVTNKLDSRYLEAAAESNRSYVSESGVRTQRCFIDSDRENGRIVPLRDLIEQMRQQQEHAQAQ